MSKYVKNIPKCEEKPWLTGPINHFYQKNTYYWLKKTCLHLAFSQQMQNLEK